MSKENPRLDKHLAERGIGSRRKCALLIKGGHVFIGSRIAKEPGERIDPTNVNIKIDGKDVRKEREKPITILLNKPRGYVCSTARQGSQTVYELINGIKERLVTVGRLDKNSEGLLLMSNDGNLVNHMTHPRFRTSKTYKVTVSGQVNSNSLNKLQSRMIIDSYQIQPAKVKLISENDKTNRTILEFTLKEGRKRQIRHMCEQADLKVHRLERTSIKHLTLKGLKTGNWRILSNEDIDRLKSDAKS